MYGKMSWHSWLICRNDVFFVRPCSIKGYFLTFDGMFHSNMSVCLSVCLYVCMSVCLYVCMSVCLSVCLSVCMSVCLYVCMSVCLTVRVSVRDGITLPIHCNTAWYEGIYPLRYVAIDIWHSPNTRTTALTANRHCMPQIFKIQYLHN